MSERDALRYNSGGKEAYPVSLTKSEWEREQLAEWERKHDHHRVREPIKWEREREIFMDREREDRYLYER